MEEAVRASVERRREEERKYYNAMRARTDARTDGEIAVAEKELKAEEARVRATNEAREASFAGTRGGGTQGMDAAARGGRTVDSSAPGIELATSAIDPAPSSRRWDHASGLGAPGRTRPRCYDPRRRRSPDAVVEARAE